MIERASSIICSSAMVRCATDATGEVMGTGVRASRDALGLADWRRVDRVEGESVGGKELRRVLGMATSRLQQAIPMTL